MWFYVDTHISRDPNRTSIFRTQDTQELVRLIGGDRSQDITPVVLFEIFHTNPSTLLHTYSQSHSKPT